MFEFGLHLLTVAGIYGLMALGLNLQAGSAGLVNFGHVAFIGLGAYGVAIVTALGAPAVVGAAAGMTAAAVVAVAMARLGRQLGSDYWGIATLAIAEILRTVALNENWLTGGAQGIGGLPAPFGQLAPAAGRLAFAALVLALLAASAWACVRLADGRFGRALRLMREEPALAASVGHDLVALKVRATVAGALLGAGGGALLALHLRYVGPDVMQSQETFLVWTMLMIGGIGNPLGAIAGAVVVQALYGGIPFLKDALGISSDLAGAMRLGAIGLALLACLLWRERGLWPERLRQPR